MDSFVAPIQSDQFAQPALAPREVPARYAHITGWGADRDHAMRPAYLMERMPARLEGDHSHPPAQQPQTVEILQSIERPSITPIFGTLQPPSGLAASSGALLSSSAKATCATG